MLRAVLLLLLLQTGSIAAEGPSVVQSDVSPDIAFLKEVISNNDRRYEERFTALQREVTLGLEVQKAAVSTALLTQKEAMALALANADRAVSKAELSAEKRFEAVNEFRATLADQQRSLMPRMESENTTKMLIERIDAVGRQLATLQAEMAGRKDGWGYAVGVAGFILMLWAAFRVVPQRKR